MFFFLNWWMPGEIECLKSSYSIYLRCWNRTLFFFFKFIYTYLSCVRYLLCYKVHRRNLPLRGEVFIHIVVGRLNLSTEHYHLVEWHKWIPKSAKIYKQTSITTHHPLPPTKKNPKNQITKTKSNPCRINCK